MNKSFQLFDFTSNEWKLLHRLWFILQDANSDIDYETRTMIVNDIADISGMDYDEVWNLQATAPELF
jgi:hypothetical protein